MYLTRLKNSSQSLLLFAGLAAISLLVTYLLVQGGVMVAPIIILSLFGIVIFIGMVMNYRWGFYVLFILGNFMFYIDRIVTSPIPLGIVYDTIPVLTFILLFINNKDRLNWTLFRSPIMIAFLVLTVYQLLQLFNPNAISTIGWLVAFRNNTSFLIFIICFQMFSTKEEIKKFVFVLIGLATMVALYGIYQEVFGLTDFETRWVYASQSRIDLLFIWGHLRKFSFLSDPSAFGLFMGFSALASLVLAMGPFKAIYRLLFLILATIMLTSMSYSGTRTSIAMVAFGIAFYILITIRSKATMMVIMAAIIGIVLVLFGPFYGGTINRIRSTFNPSEDASMGVRDRKRLRLQKYVVSHPIGGGLNTTGSNGVRYSRGHELAGGWDPDSGYLMTALELGWIGLIIGMTFFALVVLKGVSNYFAIDDPQLKTLLLTFLVPFMALSVAHFTQDAMFQKPVNLVIIATYALMIRFPMLKKSNP